MDLIQQHLGGQYAMFFCEEFAWQKLIPTQTWDQCLSTVNLALRQHGRVLSKWPTGLANNAAKLVRVSVIHQNLSREFIRKPFLVYEKNNQWILNVGDTRLMALAAASDPRPVSVLLTCRTNEVEKYTNWTRITDTKSLLEITGFPTGQVLVTPSSPESDFAFEWFEIGDSTTSHHLHDQQQRLNMMQQYLDQQPQNFQFGKDWLLKGINW